MFNKKTFRIYKKKYKITKILNDKNIYLINTNIKKNKRNSILVLFLFLKKTQINKLNKNVCSITGKYKSIFNSLKISRHEIHKLGSISLLPNYSKLSW